MRGKHAVLGVPKGMATMNSRRKRQEEEGEDGGHKEGEEDAEKEAHFSGSRTRGVYLIASHKIEWKENSNWAEHTVQSQDREAPGTGMQDLHTDGRTSQEEEMLGQQKEATQRKIQLLPPSSRVPESSRPKTRSREPRLII